MSTRLQFKRETTCWILRKPMTLRWKVSGPTNKKVGITANKYIGACGGSCACSTCHVIVEDEKLYDQMSEPDDDENDMLDLAFGLTETSRLGCQVIMSKELDGLRVKLPSMTRNMQASDFSSKS
jgi:ferredoxin